MQTNDIPRHIFIPAQKRACRCTKAVSAIQRRWRVNRPLYCRLQLKPDCIDHGTAFASNASDRSPVSETTQAGEHGLMPT